VKIAHLYLFSSILVGTIVTLATGGVVRVAARRESGSWWMKRHHHWAMRLAHAFNAAVVANTDEIVRECRTLEKLPTSKLHLIYNGIDIEALRRDIARAAPLPLSGVDGRRIGMVANLVPIKGHAVLFDAFAEVTKTHPDATLLLVGDGPLKDELNTRCRELGIADKVHFLGRTPAARLLGRIDIAVQASLSEGGSNVVLEYMAAGLPMAAPAVGANAELLRHGETARLFEPGDASGLARELNHLLDRPDEAKRMGEAARRMIETELTSRAMVARMEDLYERVLEAA
jgi:glycosyltransferase involved in cell wall biosynthesis